MEERLVKEINHWVHRYEELKLDVAAGRQPRMQPENARRRAEDLSERLERRMAELKRQEQVFSQTPVVVGGSLIVPQGWLDQQEGQPVPQWAANAEARQRIEQQAMSVVLEHERRLGNDPLDVSRENHGWDILSRTPDHEVRFLEVKGRVAGATTVTVTRNEMLAALNQPRRWFLVVVFVDGEQTDGPHCIPVPFDREPGWAESSVNLDLKRLLNLDT